MFDIAPSELLVVVLVAIVVIGPKDLPIALRTAGRWIGKMRRMSAHFRSGVEAMIREAELEEMEKKWREQNAAIMAQNQTTPAADPVASQSEASPHVAASAEAGVLSAAEAEQFHAHMPVEAATAALPSPDHPPVAKAEAST
jgi:sec-independent protein translocase protein TatB